MQKRAIVAMWPYWLICALVFYMPMLIIMLLNIGDTGVLMLLLLAIMPLVCLVTSVVFAARYKFHIVFPIGVAVLFAPVVLFFMGGLENSSGWVYVPMYFALSLVGCILGNIRHWIS